jgi:hypothetical protein
LAAGSMIRVAVSQQTLSWVLRKMGYRKLSARPRHHAQAHTVARSNFGLFAIRWVDW